MTASGTAGYGDELAAYFELSSIGAIVTKSIAIFEWAGNPAPRVHATPLGMINAVGLQGPGIDAYIQSLPYLPVADTQVQEGARSAVVTASARSVPALMWPEEEGRLSNMIGTWLPMTSFSAGPAPL